ncbi:hypothetical protein B0H11DRAFT_1987173 [Mycena galericulata]|nr:hypothetical protein B0H11DRAFT_1987173 [Mycena galericulata]
MDATTLSNLSRSKIISLAKANKIKANLSTQEIIMQLLERFPDGVPSVSKGRSTPVSTAQKLVGRVKDAFKTITRSAGPPPETPPRQQPATVETAARVTPEIPIASSSAVATDPLLPAARENLDEDNVKPAAAPREHASRIFSLPNTTFTDVTAVPPPPPPPPVADVGRLDDALSTDVSDDEEGSDSPDLMTPAHPDDVRALIQDMAAISARNKLYTEKAAAMRAQAHKLYEEAADLRTVLTIEKARRERMESYFKHWRAVDTEWSYNAVWDSTITLAPVFARFEDMNGSVMLDMEVSTSDDEELVKQWHRQDDAIRARRQKFKNNKAKERGVDVEMVSDEELASDEEEFYSPFVLRPENDDGATPDSECYVYPFMELAETTTPGIMFNREQDVIIQHGVNIANRKRPLDDGTQSESVDQKRYSPRARVEQDKGKGKMIADEDEHHDAARMKRERKLAEILGVTVDDDWEGLGCYVGGWRTRET